MDTQVRKLKKLVDQHLHKSKNQILMIFGRPKKTPIVKFGFSDNFGSAFLMMK